MNILELLTLGVVVLFLFGLLDAAIVQPISSWEAASRSRGAWMLIQILLGPLGSLAYVIVVRPELSRAKRSTRETKGPT